MLRVTCGCGKSLTTDEKNAGRKTRCPKCGAEVAFPLPEPAAVGAVEQEVAFGPVHLDGSTVAPPVGPRGVPPTRTSGLEVFQAVFFMVLALMFFWTGFGSLWDGYGFDPTSAYGKRFQTDNAVGATANAVERLASYQRPKDRGVWVLAGLLCVLILKVDGLRWTLDRRT